MFRLITASRCSFSIAFLHLLLKCLQSDLRSLVSLRSARAEFDMCKVCYIWCNDIRKYRSGKWHRRFWIASNYEIKDVAVGRACFIHGRGDKCSLFITKTSETGRIILKCILRKQNVVIWSTTICCALVNSHEDKGSKIFISWGNVSFSRNCSMEVPDLLYKN